jgi:hypothetical protein
MVEVVHYMRMHSFCSFCTIMWECKLLLSVSCHILKVEVNLFISRYQFIMAQLKDDMLSTMINVKNYLETFFKLSQ